MKPSLKAHHYEIVIKGMQGRVFYTEDEDGVLRRWYPPRVLSDADFRAGEKLKEIMGRKTKEGDE